jgi:hypothetical protein
MHGRFPFLSFHRRHPKRRCIAALQGAFFVDDFDASAAIRTVTHAADYFEELKTAANALTLRMAAESRGYFTPDEEEAILGLLVSYWQTRNALFELIITARDGFADRDPPPTAFLAGFAGALVLVDAARFLRETVAARPLLSQKLNEAAPQFGIPAGVYDTIQKSLVSARNGWRLLEASQYFHHHNDDMTSAGPDAESLVEIIDRLLPRMEVSVLDFTRAKLRTRGRQIARRVTRRVFGRLLYGMQQVVGTLMSEKYLRLGHRPRLPTVVAEEVRSLLLPGDVLIVRKEFALTNYFLPGYWPHAALFLGTRAQLSQLGIDKEPSVQSRWGRLSQLAEQGGAVLESMKDGVHLRTLDSPFRSDSIVVLRSHLSSQEVARAIARVLAHEGKPYDFDFDFRRSDRLVCTEVVYRAYDGLGGRTLPLVRRAGRPTLAGGDLIRYAISAEHFLPIAAFAPQFAPGVCSGAEAVRVLRAGSQDQDQEAGAS